MGEGCGGLKTPQQLQTLHGGASVRGSQLKLVTLHVIVALSVLAYEIKMEICVCRRLQV